MTNQNSIILFFVLLVATCASAIDCYYGIDEIAGTVHVSNIVKTQCPFDFFCFKQAKIDKKSKHYQYSYGCGAMQICSQPTCSKEEDGFKTCCCTTDYCNSGSLQFSSFTILLLSLSGIFY